jgi:hypothetical protein
MRGASVVAGTRLWRISPRGDSSIGLNATADG